MRDKLSNILNHSNCISEEVMLNYIAGKLIPLDQHRVEKHLLECEFCSDALEGLSARASVQQEAANLKDLDQRIDKLINTNEKKIDWEKWGYRIAAIVTIVALFGGGLYYLQSVKKSEKVFTENFEPYRDTTHSTPPVVVTQPAEKETMKMDQAKSAPQPQQSEQTAANQTKTDIPSSGASHVQTISTAKNRLGEDKTQSSTDIAGAEYKKEEKANDVSTTIVNDARPMVADAEKGNKKSEADDSKRGDALAKNAQPAKPLRGESLKNKSTSKEEQVQRTTAQSEYQTAPSAISERDGSGSEDLVRQGVKQYDAKNYADAISAFKQVLNTQPSNAEALFYSGVSNLSMNEDVVAINLLESVLTNSPNKFSDAAKWYLSLAYIKKNKISKAKKLLKDLSLGQSEYKSNAQKTLDELK